MSTSDKRAARGTARWLAAAALCAAFGFIYEHFSHGVSTPYMWGAFLLPLLGGALGPALLRRRAAKAPGEAARQLYGAGLATLTVGSLMKGVFLIYGSEAPLVAWYGPAGAALVLAGLACWLAQPRPAADAQPFPGRQAA